jgi:hypothetical protein
MPLFGVLAEDALYDIHSLTGLHATRQARPKYRKALPVTLLGESHGISDAHYVARACSLPLCLIHLATGLKKLIAGVEVARRFLRRSRANQQGTGHREGQRESHGAIMRRPVGLQEPWTLVTPVATRDAQARPIMQAA